MNPLLVKQHNYFIATFKLQARASLTMPIALYLPRYLQDSAVLTNFHAKSRRGNNRRASVDVFTMFTPSASIRASLINLDWKSRLRDSKKATRTRGGQARDSCNL